MTSSGPILLYDGVCGLCHRICLFVLKRDARGTFRFAALQSSFAREVVARHGANPDDLNSFCVVTEHGRPDERVLVRARAALYVLRMLGGPWRLLAVVGILPTRLLDFGYRIVARNRYRMFGRHESCIMPDPAWADRFIASE